MIGIDAKDLVEVAKTWPGPAAMVASMILGLWVAWGHFGGYARADEVRDLRRDVESIQQQVKDGRVETLEGQLFDARVAQCKADGELRKVYANRVSKLQARYIGLTGHSYTLPECNEL